MGSPVFKGVLMGSGGARNRSGPAPDPNSGRSDRRGYKLTALPSEGYQGEVPAFPLPRMIVMTTVFEEKSRHEVPDVDQTAVLAEREAEVWAEAWATPQACAWSMQSWRWPIVAEFCRLKTIVEMNPGANAQLVNQLHRYRDQIGLSPAGLTGNGWAIAVDEVGARRDERPAAAVESTAKPVRRLRAVNGAGD